MKIKDFKQPYGARIVDILESNSNRESLLTELKLYVLNEPYFKQFHSEPTWVAYEIFKEIGGHRWMK
tara:strand:+ start:1447 stop:1647 length:201 start_codon:yes stop_codon:yes gene_type:complete